MANQVRVNVSAPGAKGSASEIDKLRDRFEKLQKQGAKGFAIGAGAAVTTKAFDALGSSVGMAVDFMQSAVKAGSDLRESQTLTAQIFGESADQVERWAENTEDAFSKREALDYLSAFGNLLQGAGLGLEDAIEKSKTLTNLAGDLGSAFNTSSAEAAQAIKSGLVGESEPLRRFGIMLSEAKVKAEAYATGIAKAGEELTESQKALARYQIILKETTKVQGTFGADAESAADAQKKLQTNLEDVSAKIGQELLPVLVDLANFANDELVPAIDGIAKAAKDAAPVFDALGTAAGLAGDGVRWLIDPLSVLQGNLWEEALAAAKAGRAHADFLATTKGLPPGVRGAGKAVADLTGAVDDSGEAADEAEDRYDSFADVLKGAASDADRLADAMKYLSGELFDQEILAGDLAQAQLDLKEAQAELKGITNKSSLEYKAAAGEVAEYEQRIFELQYQMKQTEGPQALHDWLIKQKAALDGSNAALQTQIDKLITIAARARDLAKVTTGGIVFTGIPSGGGKRAEGGPVDPNKPYLVGEKGPEVVVPRSAGTVIPNDEIGGTTNIINLTVQGSLVARNSQDVVAALQRAAAFIR